MDKEAIVLNYIGRKGAGPVVAYAMAKSLVDMGERVVAILPATIENRRLWEELPCDKIIFIDSYHDMCSFLKKTIFFKPIERKIKREIQGIPVKAVYVPMASFWAERINKIFGEVKVITVCHDPIPHSGKDMILSKLGLNKGMYHSADIVIVHSKKFLPYMKKRCGNVRYLPLGPHNMYRNVDKKVKIIEYERDKINFLFFGRIDEYKGIDILAEAFWHLEKDFYGKVSLTVVGNGNFSKYEKFFEKLQNVKVINRWIRDEEVESVFLGENLVTVCPYKDATQSGVVLISYDYGVPVIASDTGGLAEQVLDGRTGFLVRPNDADALRRAMELFVKTPGIRIKMKKEIATYMSEISWEESAKKLLGMIGEGRVK